MRPRFLLLVHADPRGWEGLDDAEASAAIAARAAAIDRLRREGVLLACSPLADPGEGVEVRVRGGAAIATVAEADAAPIAGFYLVEADDLQHAVQLAGSIPDAADAHMTVRALLPIDGIPAAIPPLVA